MKALDYQNLGGLMMPMAKSIPFAQLGDYVPQHYFSYRQDLGSISRTLACITTLPNILFFTGEDAGGLYLQVGVIGDENYRHTGKSAGAKLVYGRKWRIDTDTPTSEVVQTALLAVQKVREHEVRELFSWRDPVNKRTSTPFSCHQDIQLLVRYLALPSSTDTPMLPAETGIREFLQQLRFGSRRFRLKNLQQLPDGRQLADIVLGKPKVATESFAEFDQLELSLIFRQFSAKSLMHDLMDLLIQKSHDHCRNNFLVCEVARFSQEIDPRVIGALSVQSRPYQSHMADTEFFQTFSAINFSIDKGRVPQLGRGVLADINRRTLSSHGPLEGHLPEGVYSEYKPAVILPVQSWSHHELATDRARQCA
jgi:hypothetical protein